MVTKTDVGREGHNNSGSVWNCGDRGLFKFDRAVSM